MATDTPAITLDPSGDGYVLTRRSADGAVATIDLSDTDVLALAQAAAALQQEALSRRAPAKGSRKPIAATLVADIEIAADMMGENLLLAMVSPSGGRTIFALPSPIARKLVDAASGQLEKMRAARPTRQ